MSKITDRHRPALVDSAYAVAPDRFYWEELSHAPGWKVGGRTRWGLTDRIPGFTPNAEPRRIRC
ncbi:hypothetical protein [Streptomyces chromofuscus]|uniref:hypothetical protein n=1 Tax=Streptomyces chromofuscus TaxID=42881 RepID=UPI001678EFC1|nr:hypothetical protein [Streptomyces chromofuscus]GGT43857.1 hypothetical protein GCM10010254_73860 [Streptomyces chromofuscus]